MDINLKYLLLCSVAFLLPHNLIAQEPLVIDANVEKMILGSHLALFEDPSGELIIEDILTPEIASQFQVSETKSPNFGHIESVIWARFHLQNLSEINMNWFLELGYPLIMDVQLFVQDSSGNIVNLKSGSMTSIPDRPISHRSLLFPIAMPPQNIQTYYLRVITETALTLDLYLWSRMEFMSKDHNAQFLLGIYYGILLIMLVYNLFIYLSLRDSSYLYYVLFVIGFGSYQLLFDGLAMEFFWPNRPDLNWSYLTIFGGTIVFAGTQFARKILLSAKHSPILDKFMLVIVLSSLLFIIFSRNYSLKTINFIFTWLVLFYMSTSLIASIFSVSKGYRPAKYYLVAQFLFFLGMYSRVFRNAGILPDNTITAYLLNIGSVVEITLFSFSLADRINILKQEKADVIAEGRDQYRTMTQDLLAAQAKEHARGTELEQSQTQLRELLRFQQKRIEEERTFIAREVHDELGQELSLMQIELYWIEQHLPPESTKLLEKTRGIASRIDDTVGIVQKICTELRPTILDNLGLRSAIEWQTSDFQKRTGISCEFSSNVDEIKLDSERSTSLFRIYQETLTNVVRHAEADHVRITLDRLDKQVKMSIRDNGKGIPLENIKDPRSLGLMGMRERIRPFEGTLEISHLTPKGTSIEVILPITSEAN